MAIGAAGVKSFLPNPETDYYTIELKGCEGISVIAVRQEAHFSGDEVLVTWPVDEQLARHNAAVLGNRKASRYDLFTLEVDRANYRITIAPRVTPAHLILPQQISVSASMYAVIEEQVVLAPDKYAHYRLLDLGTLRPAHSYEFTVTQRQRLRAQATAVSERDTHPDARAASPSPAHQPIPAPGRVVRASSGPPPERTQAGFSFARSSSPTQSRGQDIKTRCGVSP